MNTRSTFLRVAAVIALLVAFFAAGIATRVAADSDGPAGVSAAQHIPILFYPLVAIPALLAR